jgi:hypothetical protein
MINFNIDLKNLDWYKLKNINLTNVFLLFCSFGVVCLFFKDEIKKKLEKENKTAEGKIIKEDQFGRSIEKNIRFEYILQDMQEKYNCTYVNVNVFHNGDSTKWGFHFDKMSCIEEAVRHDQLKRGYKLKNWSIEPFAQKFAKLYHEGHLYLPNLRTEKDAYFNTTLTRMGCISVVYVAIYDNRYIDKNGLAHIVGFLSFQWDEPTNISNAKKISMIKEVERIKEFVIKK